MGTAAAARPHAARSWSRQPDRRPDNLRDPAGSALAGESRQVLPFAAQSDEKITKLLPLAELRKERVGLEQSEARKTGGSGFLDPLLGPLEVPQLQIVYS